MYFPCGYFPFFYFMITLFIMFLLIGYTVILLTIGIIDFKRVKDFNEYVLAGRRQKRLLVTVSLVASMIGSGSTIGMANNAFRIGFPAFWFLAVGGIGLILQSVLLSEKVRESGAVSLPDLADKTMGREVRVLVSVIIVITWIGIISAQFIAAKKLIVAMTGWNSVLVLPGIAAVIILYSFFGGQSSILKTDLLQQGILIVAVLFTVIFVFVKEPVQSSSIRFEVLNDQFRWTDLIYYLTLVMGSYFICPMMFSRLLTAKTPAVAKKSSLWAGLGVVAFAVVITLIGVWARHAIPDLENKDVLSYIFLHKLPRIAGLLLLLGLLSAIVSTVDTSLVMTSSIIEHDIFGRTRVGWARGLVIIIGILGTGAAVIASLRETNIIGILLEAFAIYTAGIVPTLFIALMFIKKRQLHRPLAFTAILAGGVMGVLAKILGMKYLGLYGMIASTVIALAAVYLQHQQTADSKE